MDVHEESWPISPKGRYRLSCRGVPFSDPDYIVVRGTQDLQRLSADILGDRDRPIVGLGPCVESPEPVLPASDVRAIVGADVRIYLVADDELLQDFKRMVGARLKLERGVVRVWWPSAAVHCDPVDHPLVVALEGERVQDTLEELARQFDLSRPRVRNQIRLAEDSRAFLEDELAALKKENRKIGEQLRDAKIESHRMRTRAEAAEARLTATPRPPETE